MKKIFFLIIIILIINKIFSIIYFDIFSTLNNLTSNNFYNFYIENNNLLTYLNIGTPSQKIPIYIKFNFLPFVIPDTSIQGIYNKSLSKTYNFIKQENDFTIYYPKVNISKEKFIFNQFNNNSIQSNNNFNFALGISYDFEFDFIPGCLGLKVSESDYYEQVNFIIQLKKQKIINKYSFYLDFDNNNENSIGKLIIGAYPHELNKKYNEKNLFVSNICIEKKYLFEWNLIFNSIFVGNKKIEDEIVVNFRPDFGGFLTNEEFYNYIFKSYFEIYFNSNVCFIENVKKKDIFYFVCYKNKINVKNFPKINFYNKNFNFTFFLDFNDLFVEFNEFLYFNIFFQKGYEKKIWTLGLPFFKKYLFVFDYDKKIVGFYNENLNIVNKNYNKYLKIIIIFILLMIIIFLLVFIYKNYLKNYFKNNNNNKFNEIGEEIKNISDLELKYKKIENFK